MRLLELKAHGDLGFTEDIIDNIPPYAILSHTWGGDNEEVTFDDLVKGTGKTKAGYKKIQFCGEQATADGFQYFWVDTCCINKSSSAELSEAINSMFRWYHDAAKCYVYLSDVSASGFIANDLSPQSTWELAFRESRWFTRGWTLQELIAPVIVEFFSFEGRLLGDKKSLELLVHEITDIPVEALQGSPLARFTVDERMLWAAKRTTKRKEDEAYCLFGIFDIHMPLLYGEGRVEAFIRLRDEISKRSGNFQLEEVPNIPQTDRSFWIVPFDRNPNFTGRGTQLAEVGEKLFRGCQTTKVAIWGLGGVGKTQLMLELVYQIKNKHKNCSVIWIPAMNTESLYQTYLDIAKQLRIPAWEDKDRDVKKLVQEYLTKDDAGQWLLVFDNADDIDMWIAKPGPGSGCTRGSVGLVDCLPRSKQGSIVFTTRDRKTAVKLAQENIVEVREMSEEFSLQLLQKCLVNPNLVNNQQDAMALLTELTYLPLAIVQAAAYINENEITIAEYLLLLEEQEEEVVDLLSEDFQDAGRYRNVKNPVATTWLISFEQIRRRDALAADYLSFMSCINPKEIPQSLLPPGPSRKKEIEAIGTLNAYSFISKRPVGLALDLHRLVHLSMRNWLRKEKLLAQSAKRVIVRLDEVFPDYNNKNRTIWRIYLPHVRYVLESDLVDKDWKNRINLIERYGICLYEDGRWNEAEAAITEVLKIEKRDLGVEHPDTLTSMSNLALTYKNQGRWIEAEELNVQVLETSLRVLGAEHPDTLTSMANLAATFWRQGRLKEAEELNVQVIERRKRVLGIEHPETLTSMANLALTYSNQGRWKEAKELNVQVMETSLRVFGEEHPLTLTSMANLASTYRNQGQLKEAEELNVQVIEIRKRVLGTEHPGTLTSMANLALTYSNQGRWKEAEELNT